MIGGFFLEQAPSNYCNRSSHASLLETADARTSLSGSRFTPPLIASACSSFTLWRFESDGLVVLQTSSHCGRRSCSRCRLGCGRHRAAWVGCSTDDSSGLLFDACASRSFNSTHAAAWTLPVRWNSAELGGDEVVYRLVADGGVGSPALALVRHFCGGFLALALLRLPCDGSLRRPIVCSFAILRLTTEAKARPTR